MSDRLFDVEEYPEAPVLRPPRGRKGAAVGASLDARFLNDYPPEWGKCPACHGTGLTGAARSVKEPGSTRVKDWIPERCPECRGMGSVKARVRLDAGHRCERCRHPYIPKGDAAMLGVEPSGLHDCERCAGRGLIPMLGGEDPRDALVCEGCKGTGKVWSGWSVCDAECSHEGPIRVTFSGKDDPLPPAEFEPVPGESFTFNGRHFDGWVGPEALLREEGVLSVEAAWRVLTVHHLDGDKANLRWWNLAALCQRCHLEIQAKVVMERVYPHEHSGWFRPHAAGYYAFVYLCGTCGLRRDDPTANHYTGALPGSPVNEHGMYPHRPDPLELTREETLARLDELLALELAA